MFDVIATGLEGLIERHSAETFDASNPNHVEIVDTILSQTNLTQARVWEALSLPEVKGYVPYTPELLGALESELALQGGRTLGVILSQLRAYLESHPFVMYWDSITLSEHEKIISEARRTRYKEIMG